MNKLIKALLKVENKEQIHKFLKETTPDPRIWNELLKEMKQS